MDNITKNILAAVCAVGSFVLGEWCGHLTALVALVVIDYISGVIAAIVEKKLSSEIGAKGIAKKIFMFFIVAVANIVDVNVIGEGHVLKTVTVAFYIANECISLIENAGRLGVPVPKKLLDVLKQLKDKEK